VPYPIGKAGGWGFSPGFFKVGRCAAVSSCGAISGASLSELAHASPPAMKPARFARCADKPPPDDL
jgi:hypothetical protein